MVKVQHIFAGGVVIQGVGGKVATQGVVFLTAEYVVTQNAAAVGNLGIAIVIQVAAAEGGYFHRLIAKQDMHQAKAPTNDARAAEHAVDLLGRGVGRDIKVLGALFE